MADYGLPRTVLRVRQGILPALRAGSGQHVIIIADRRVQTKGYGPIFLRSVPYREQRLLSTRDIAPAVADWVRTQ
jgi:ATP-dependent DNA helicase DinG